MRVLVTGGAGYVGSHVAKGLARAGFEPVVFDSFEEGPRRAVRWGPFVEGNLADAALVRRVLEDYRIEGVVHAAAYAYVGESVRHPRKYFRNNVANTLTLLDAMLDTGVPSLVFSSSCTVYGEPREVPIPEDHPSQPMSPYGESKLFVERVLGWYGQVYPLRWVALRYFNAAGADAAGEIGEDHDPETHLIPLAIYAALGRRPALEIYGDDYPTRDGTAVRDFVHVTDLADAHVRSLAYLHGGGESTHFNIGAGRGHSVREIVQAVETASGKPVPTVVTGRRAGDPPMLVADASRAGRVLGWQPRHSTLPNIVETAWRWHTSQLEPQRAVPG